MAEAEALRASADALFPRDGGIDPPSEVIASWPSPNYVDPETRDWTAPIVLMAILGLTFLIYVARMWARTQLAKNAGLDDWLISVAMIPLFGLTIAAVLGVKIYGFQWHAWDQTAETVITSRQITLAIEVTYLVSTSLIKISILCFYRRLTSGSISMTFVYWVWASIAFVTCYGIVFTFVIVFSCSPVEGYWHIFDLPWRIQNELHCRNEGPEIVSVVVISTLQDFFICALPIVLVWNLKIPRQQKAALIAIFGMGLLTCVCGIMRMYYAIYVYYYTYDITWYAYYGWIWTALEADLGVICASAPALKVFFRRYFNLSADRSGNSYSSWKKKYGKPNPVNSQGVSNAGNAPWENDTYPMNQIKVQTGMDITAKHRDDVNSQKSDASTKDRTVQSFEDEAELTEWVESCKTICAAFRPEWRSNFENRGLSKDIESDLDRD